MLGVEIAKSVTINNQISSPYVVLINEKGENLGKVNIDQAKLLACEKEMDLVEVSGNAAEPVCKIIDYKKLIYQKNKQIQKQKAKQKAPEVKEIKLSINIGKHDLEVKANHAKEFLADKDKVRIFIVLRGREKMFSSRAYEIIEKFSQLVDGEFEENIKRLGSMFSAIIKKKG